MGPSSVTKVQKNIDILTDGWTTQIFIRLCFAKIWHFYHTLKNYENLHGINIVVSNNEFFLLFLFKTNSLKLKTFDESLATKSSLKLFVFGMIELQSWKKIIEATHIFHIFYFLGNSNFFLSQTNNTAQKIFPLRIYSVNVTKYTVFCEFCPIYWINL